MKVITADDTEIDLGTVETAPAISIVDYSRRDTDAFGATTVVKRGFSRQMSVRVSLPFNDVDRVEQQLTALRATPVQWIADDRFAWLSVEGFYKNFELDLAVPPLSYCTLTVEGIAETEIVADAGGDPAPEGSVSTLRLLQPNIVSDAMLSASSVAEDDYPEWVFDTVYASAARVIKAADHRIYESIYNGNVDNDPTLFPVLWLDVGPTNRWAMFDQAVGTATASVGAVAVALEVDDVDAVALVDVVADTVRVEAPGYDTTKAVNAGGAVFLDLPASDGPITVTAAGAGAVSVGTLLVGRVVSLGLTGESPTAGIIDFSRKNTDAFGEVTVVERAAVKRMTAKALISTDAVDLVANRIASVRATPSLWIGDEGLGSLTVYGFFKDFSIDVDQNVSTLSLAIEGLSETAMPLAPADFIYATRNVPAQMLQDGIFLDQYWSRDGLARAFAYSPAPSGYALEIPYNGDVASFSGYGGSAGLYMEIHPGKRLWVRFECSPAGHELVDLYDGDDLLFDGGEQIIDDEYADADWQLEAAMAWFQADGTPISTSALVLVDPVGGQQTLVELTNPPPLARRARLLFGLSAQAGKAGSWAVWSPWVGEHQPSADVTGENAPTMEGPPDQTVQAGSDGTVKTGQLPRTLRSKRYLGGIEVTLDAEWAAEFNGLAGSIDNDPDSPMRGAITVEEPMPGNAASATITSTYDGVVLSKLALFTKALAPPDIVVGGGSAATTVVQDVSAEIIAAQTAYAGASASATIAVATGQTLMATVPLSYVVEAGTAKLAGKWQYSAAGAGIWTDFGAEIVGTTATKIKWYEPEEGSIYVNQSAAGLTAGDYDVRLMLRLFSGTSDAFANGTATMKAE